MKSPRTLSSVVTLVVSAAVVAGVVFLGASASTRTPGIALDCRGNLRVQASFAREPGERGASSGAGAAREVAKLVLDDHDSITSEDGYQLVRSGKRTVAAVTVIETPSGSFADTIDACAEDYVSP